MRNASLVGLVLLSACATAPAEPIIHGETPGHTCQDSGLDAYVGKAGTKANGAAIKHLSKAAILRWAPPNVMLTMDYRADRVTIWLDDSKKITKIHCG